jgi:hypothetical protein
MTGAHAASSTITQTSSGLVASDSLTSGNTAAWTINGNAPAGGSTSTENSSGLYLGVKTGTAGTYSGFFAKSPSTSATLFHAALSLTYKTIPDNSFNTGLYVQTSNTNFIDYVACVAVVSATGYYWSVVQATGPAVGSVTTTNLWVSTTSTMPLTQDCTIVTNGNNYLKVYLGGNVVYQNSSLMLNMPSPFNAILEVQTNSASAMRFGSFLAYYATSDENVNIANAPAGGTVKIVDSANNVLATAPVSSTGTAAPSVGQYRLPLTASIQAYDSTGAFAASTPGASTTWGGDSYTLTSYSTTTSGTPVAAVTQTQSGLDKSDSLATGNMAYWVFDGSASRQPGSKISYSEDAQGLHIGVQSPATGFWSGYYARSPNTTATLYHLTTTLSYTTMPTGESFNTGLYVQTWDNTWINYIGCVAQVTSSGYFWEVVQSFGPGTGAATITVLYQSAVNTMPLTEDCSVITNGQHYLKVYLGGNVVVNRNDLNLTMPAPFNSYLEPQTTSASSMHTGTYTTYYSTFGEDVNVTNAPPGGTVKLVDSTNAVLASASVTSSGTATLPIGKFQLPLTAFVRVYDPVNDLVASTSTAMTIWGGDVYAVSSSTSSTTSTTSTTSTSMSTTSTSTSATSTSTTTSITSAASSQLNVATQNTAGAPLANYWTQLWQNGVTVASGYTPASYTLVNGQLYTIEADGYGSCAFDHWLDNGSTNNMRDITVTSNTSLVAVLKC